MVLVALCRFTLAESLDQEAESAAVTTHAQASADLSHWFSVSKSAGVLCQLKTLALIYYFFFLKSEGLYKYVGVYPRMQKPLCACLIR